MVIVCLVVVGGVLALKLEYNSSELLSSCVNSFLSQKRENSKVSQVLAWKVAMEPLAAITIPKDLLVWERDTF